MRLLALLATLLGVVPAFAQTAAYRIGPGGQMTTSAARPTTLAGRRTIWPDTSNRLRYWDGTADLQVAAIAAATKGDMAVWTGSAWALLAAGANGLCLKTDSTETTGLEWGSCGGGGGASTGNWTFSGDTVDLSGAGTMTLGGANTTGISLLDDVTLASGKTFTGAAASDLLLNAVSGQQLRLRINGSNMLSISSTASTFAGHILAASDESTNICSSTAECATVYTRTLSTGTGNTNIATDAAGGLVVLDPGNGANEVEVSTTAATFTVPIVPTTITGFGYIGMSDQAGLGSTSTTSGTFADIGDGTTTGFATWTTPSIALAKTYLLQVTVTAYYTGLSGKASYQILVDGVAVPGQPTNAASQWIETAEGQAPTSWMIPVALTAGTHVIKIQWKTSVATLNVNANCTLQYVLWGSLMKLPLRWLDIPPANDDKRWREIVPETAAA
jgi:hypothetical protein